MTIVANDSITVSNVNDGKITHTAWSYSADGTDGFTTVYPNLNLLNFNSGVTLGKYYGWGAGITSWSGNRAYLKKVKVTPNKQYTISANWSNAEWLNVYAFTNESDTIAVARYGSVGSFGVGSWDSKFAGGYTVSNNMTFTVPANVNYIGVSYASISTDTLTLQALLNGKPKLEQGSLATPYMQSASEVTTADWPKYIGQYTDFTQTDSTNPSDYTWSLMRGSDGKDGADGTDGIAGKDGKGIKATAITYQASTNGTTAPTDTWSASVPTVAKGSFLWTRTIWTYTDNTTETGYAVAYMGTNGNNGTNGVAGKDGVGIATTTITYAGSTSGTTAPTSGWTSAVPTVAAGSYLWTKTVWTYTDNTSETGYSVARMGNNGATGPQGPQGLKGDPGATGIPGQAGIDGKTSYLHIAYATNSTGTTGFDVSNATGKTYIGQYTDFTSTDSTDPSKYTWSLIKGDKGDKGDPGIKGSDGTSGIIVSSVAPASPQTGQLWQDTSTTPQLIKKWTGSSWVIWEFYAENIKANSLQTVSAKIGKIYNEFDNSSGGIDNKGTITIEDSVKVVYYLGNSSTTIDLVTSSSGQGLFTQYLPDKTDASKFKQSWYMPTGLYFTDSINNWNGQITAENVTLVPWTNITYSAGYTTAEDNPCQYRKIKNLDGSYTVQFRGQVKPVSGNFPTTGFGDITLLPTDIRPTKNSFVNGVGNVAGSQTIRIGAIVNGAIQIGVRGTATSYVAIDSLSYTL